MTGQGLQDSCVIIAVTGSGLCLSYALFGLKTAITFGAITAAGIALKLTLLPRRVARSRKASRKRASSHTKSLSEGAIAQSNKENIPPPVLVTPDGWVSKRRATRKPSKHSAAISRLPNFDETFSA